MAGLSQELIAQCIEVLSRCEELDSQDTLRAVFVTDQLMLYRSRLPDARSKTERISLTVDYLRLQYLSDGQAVLPLFLYALRDLRPLGDSLRDELDALGSETYQKLNELETIDIPFVIAAMTHKEATELADETSLERPDIPSIEISRIQQLKDSLVSYGITDWDSCYGQRREDWRPMNCSNSTIDEIIVSMVDYINRSERGPESLPVIRWQPFSENFFSMNSDRRMDAWDYLRQAGAVLVVDTISLFHPFLRNTLLQSALASDEKISVLMLSPVNSSDVPVHDLIENLIKDQMVVTFSRYDAYLDSRCEIGTGGLRALQRWLFAALPETIEIVKNQVVIANRRVVRQRVNKEPRGIDQAVFMGGEVTE